MRTTELIERLKKLVEENGDLEITSTYGWNGEVFVPNMEYVKVRNRKILKGREYLPRYWEKCDGEERRGEKVIAI
jgi:uncharacterized protein YkuJ